MKKLKNIKIYKINFIKNHDNKIKRENTTKDK